MPAYSQCCPPGTADTLELDVDRPRARLTVTIRGQAKGLDVWPKLCAAYSTHPEMTGYDMLFDIREYCGDVVADDVKPIVEVYAEIRVPEAEGTRTAFLTSDPSFRFWAQAMTFQFPGRLHQAFQRLEDAEAFLAVPRSQR